jgi:hypothetical protein
MVVGIAATIASFSQTSNNEPAPAEERTLTSKTGNSTMFRLVEKSSDSIVANRSSDGKRFVIPLASLSGPDQEFLKAWTPRTAKPLESINTPTKVFLALPFDKQDRGGICTAAALLNIIQYVDPGVQLSQEELFTLFNDGRSGAAYPQMQAALRTLGYDSEELKFDGKDDETIIEKLKKSLLENIPALAAKSGHMITAIGFDSTNPYKKIITIWDQRSSKEGATDLESLGIVNMDEKEFSRRLGTLILIKPKEDPIMDEAIAKNRKMLIARTNREVSVYKFTPPTNEPDLAKYITHSLEARILIELRKNNRDFFPLGESLSEIITAPDPKDRNKIWITKSTSDKPLELNHITLKGFFFQKQGLFYSVGKPITKPTTK